MTAAHSDHLNLDAIVAFADGEMTLVAYQRAAAHVARCPQCDNEVNQQVVARSWLRAAGSPAMPNSLLDTLKSIPVAVPASRPVDGVTIDPVDRPGRSVRRCGARRHHRGWRFRFLGAGALVAGLAVGALVVGADQQDAEPAGPNGQQGANLSAVSSPFVVPVKLGTPVGPSASDRRAGSRVQDRLSDPSRSLTGRVTRLTANLLSRGHCLHE